MHKTFVSIPLIAAVALLTGTAFAGQPVTQTLTPTPPSFLTCKAMGSGTICEGSRAFTVDPHPDFVCASGVVIYDQGTVRQVVIRYYDTNGNLTRRVIHEFWSDAQKSNPLTGASASYTQSSNITDVLAVPGDFSSATETVTGQGSITVPGLGAVLLNAGRFIFGPDGTLDFRAGPQAFLDYGNGDISVTDRLCAALA